MAQDTNNKEYIKNLITNALEGKKINKQESEELVKTVTNFNENEWQNFKIIAKEVFKESIDKKITESGQIPSNWQNEVKNFLHSLVDLGSEMASQEIILESVRLEKQKIPYEQRIKILIPLYTKQIDKIAARKQPRKISDSAYHKAEKSLVKKVKQIKSMFEMAKMGVFVGKKPTKTQALGAVKKLISLFKNLSADEILVAKEKGKSLIIEYFEHHAPLEFRQKPEMKAFINSCINFSDALYDDKLVAEALRLAANAFEIALEQIDFEKLMDMASSKEAAKYGASFGLKIDQALKKGGMESRAQQLLVNLTNHINRLASEEVNNNNISTTEEQQIAQKLFNSRQLSSTNNNSSNNTGTGLAFISPVSTFGSIEGGNNNSGGLSEEQLFNKFLDKFTTVESKGKWYQNPWFIGFSIVGGLVVGGLAIWLLMRRKKEKVKVDNRRDYW